jgi:glycosyltransferase involved in cell wall biosynthesis
MAARLLCLLHQLEALMKISVVIPVYNERRYIAHVLARVQAVSPEKEIIVVDDASTDGTRELLESIHKARLDHRPCLMLADLLEPLRVDNISVYFQPTNRGKGAALRRGFQMATGDLVIVQDADLEYDPNDYNALTSPITSGLADVVYGSRFLGGPHRVLFFWHYVANRMLTLLSNMLNNLNLTDMETCYKVFRREVLAAVDLRQNRFGFEPEITAKVAALGVRVYEVPVSYHGRTYEEGKKIGWRDAVQALWCIVRYGVFTSRRRVPVAAGAFVDPRLTSAGYQSTTQVR